MSGRVAAAPSARKGAGRAALLAFLLLLPLPAFAADGGLTLLYSASLNGNLGGCPCISHPRAGLVKRAAWLKDLPREERERALLLDAGDLLDVSPDELLADEILQVYRELGYDAVVPGEQELSNGVAALLSYRDRIPLMAHNLAVCPDADRCLFFSAEPPIIERGGVRVGLLALVDPQAFRLEPPEVLGKLKIRPPVEAAKDLVAQLRQRKAQLVVLLFHGTYGQAAELVRRVGGIDVAIVGHEQQLIEARRVGRTLLASPGEEGNRVGILRLSLSAGRVRSFTNEFRLFRYDTDPDDPGTRLRFDRYRQKLRARLPGG